MMFLRFVCICLVITGIALAQTNPVPFVNQPLVPTSVAPGGSTFGLTINGTGFVSGAVVNWNGTALDTTFVSSSRLAATVPAANIMTATTAAVTVTNSGPGGGSSNPVFFPVSVPANSLAFTNTQILTTGASPSSIAVGDFNRDGKLDLAVANKGSATVSIFLGNGDGTFQTKVDYATIASPVGITTADLRGNGILDLAVVTPGEISVLLGNGDATFQPHVDYPGYPVGSEPLGGIIVAADFNRDGKLDLAAAYGEICDPTCGSPTRRPPMVITQGFTSVFLGNGDGTFQPYISTSSAPGGESAAAGDFNNDSKIDLTSALGNADTFNVSDIVGLGNGDGTFKISYGGDDGGGTDSYGNVIPFVAAADFNGDGNLDFMVCNSGNVSVLLGNGDGTFQTPIISAGGCSSAALGDFHGNGFLDLATQYAIFTGNYTGEFPESGDVILPNGSGNQPVWVSAADFNGDGKLDVVLANPNNTVWVDLQSGNAIPSPTSLSLYSYIGTTSAPQTVTLSNTAGAGLAISVISTSTGFAQTNNCPVGGSLPPGSDCAIKVTFTPTDSGTTPGTLSITDDGPGSPQTIGLTGTVQGFAIAATSQTSVTVTPGQVANYAVSISPVNGFNQTVQLSCSGAPTQATCTVTPNSVTLDGSKPLAANIAAATMAAAMGSMRPYGGPSVSEQLGSWLTVLIWMALTVLTCLTSWRGERRRQWLRRPALLCLLMLEFTMTGCGGGSGNGGGGTGGTPTGSYNLTVTGTFTSGPTQLIHTTQFTLVVQ